MSGLRVKLSGRAGALALDLDLEAPAEGLTAVTGPSGSGKTTLLRAIAGLTRLDGHVSFGGEVWQEGARFVPAHRRPIGYVFQEASLLAHLSVRGNLDYAARRAGSPVRIGRDEVIAMLGLEPLLPRAPDRLSGGERQRAAIGRALLTQPRILLMDEPVSSLDAASKQDILPYLDRLHRSLAIPVLYVTHDQAEVRRLADHVRVIAHGRVAASLPRQAFEDQARERLRALDPQARDALALAALHAGLSPD